MATRDERAEQLTDAACAQLPDSAYQCRWTRMDVAYVLDADGRPTGRYCVDVGLDGAYPAALLRVIAEAAERLERDINELPP